MTHDGRYTVVMTGPEMAPTNVPAHIAAGHAIQTHMSNPIAKQPLNSFSLLKMARGGLLLGTSAS